jgi:hypothetical protein
LSEGRPISADCSNEMTMELFPRDFPFQTARKIIRAALWTIVGICLMSCSCGFAPGWANGWNGLSKHVVFASVFTAILLVTHLAVAALSAPLCAYIQWRVQRPYTGWIFFCLAMVVALGIGIYDSSRMFPVIRDSIAKEWP